MRFEGFSIEILVNGQPLTEYNLPVENSSNVTTGRSYVVTNEFTKEKKYSESTTYVAVREPGSRFVVRYSSNRSSLWNPMMAYVYVDGEYDYTYREILSSTYREKDCFWNNSLDKKYYFKFAITEMTDTCGQSQLAEQKTCGGLGAISIYFYKARIIPQRNVVIPPFSVGQVQVSESKNNVGIKMTTAFDVEGGYVNRQPISTMEKQSDDPVAVLHLHYRPADWLRTQGFNIPNLISPLSTDIINLQTTRRLTDTTSGDRDESENATAKVQLNNITTKCKVIRESVTRPVIIIKDDEDIKKGTEIINPGLFGTTFSKRKYEDIEVILLDSGDEGEKPEKLITKRTRVEC